MNRRAFLRGTALVSVMALASRLRFDDGIALNYIAHPNNPAMFEEIGERYAKALANSMIQTREITMAEALKGTPVLLDSPEYTRQIYGTHIWWQLEEQS